jgi:hypothetical protein
VVELLAVKDATADELARRVRVAMSGGFDLEALRDGGDETRLRAQAKKQSGELRAADGEVERLRRAHEELARREDDRAQLEAKREAARRARVEREAADIALELAAKRAEREAVVAESQALPPELKRLAGNEAERFDDRRKVSARKQDDRARKRADAAKAEQRMRAAGFRSAPPSDAELAECRERLTACEKLFGRAREVERNVLAARTALADSAQKLAAVAPGEPPVDLRDEDLTQADEWLGRFAQLAAGIAARQQFVETLERERTREPAPDHEEKTLEARIHWLSAWLKREAAPVKGAGLAWWVALALALIGALVAWRWPTPGLGLAIAALLALVALSLRWKPKRDGGRAPIERELASLGLDAGAPWTSERASREIAAAVEALAARRRAAMYADEEGRAKSILADEQQRLAQWIEHRSGLVRRLRLPESVGDVALRDVVERVAAWRRARIALDVTEADRVAADGQLDAELARLRALLGRFGVDEPADVQQAKAFVQDLERRSQEHEAARREREQALQDAAALEAEVHELHAGMKGLLASAGLAGEPGDETALALRERLSQRPRFVELTGKSRDLDVQIRELRRRLESTGRLDLEARPREQLERTKAEAGERENQFDDLTQQLSNLRSEVDRAKEGVQLEGARARERDAREALAATREALLDAALRRQLLDRLRQRHEEFSQPPVYERARALFRRFTRGEWDLVVAGRGDAATFRAQRPGELALDVGQLSDGTRAQLLLAARVAFAIEAERGVELPLFLDEALAVSDAARFSGAVEALLELARQGRQVIYLAADEKDVEHWKALVPPADASLLHEVDLAEVRRIASAASPVELRVPPRPAVPAPCEQSAEEYAACLGVPAFDPLEPIEKTHLFHALRDQLPLLHRALDVLGVETVGAWENVVAATRAPPNGACPGFDAVEQARIDARIACARAWHAAFNEGRGRRVDRDALSRSLAVSENYLDRLCELAKELDGDAPAIVDRLENPSQDPRTRGFRADKKDALATYLETNGYLDRRPRLAPERIRARVLETAQPWIDRGVITVQEVIALVHVLDAVSLPRGRAVGA